MLNDGIKAAGLSPVRGPAGAAVLMSRNFSIVGAEPPGFALIPIALVFSYFAWFNVLRIFSAGVAAIGTLVTPIVGAVAPVLPVPAGEPVAGRRAPGPR